MMTILGITIALCLVLACTASIFAFVVKQKRNLEAMETAYLQGLHDIARKKQDASEALIQFVRQLGNEFYTAAIPPQNFQSSLLTETGISAPIQQREKEAQEYRKNAVEKDIEAALSGDVLPLLEAEETNSNNSDSDLPLGA